ncbi:GNAT family N-acetyltransferase [Stappia sp.]|uniref:GNAT family N-acetyltransferase n=1 Tax=Stappia sp. TaxID=1870903 RepID=UPI003A99AB0C
MTRGENGGEDRSGQLTLRPLALDDTPAFARLLADYGQEMRNGSATAAAGTAAEEAAAARLLADPLAHILGAFDAEMLVGFALYFDLPEAISSGRAGQLDDLFVASGARGRRLAERLVSAVAAQGRSRGWVHLRWLVPEENRSALRLYDRIAEQAPWKSYVLRLEAADRR